MNQQQPTFAAVSLQPRRDGFPVCEDTGIEDVRQAAQIARAFISDFINMSDEAAARCALTDMGNIRNRLLAAIEKMENGLRLVK